MRASPAVRSLRAAVFAALCVLLAAGGHTLATGMTPPVWAQAIGFLPVFGAGWLLGGRERPLGAIGAATLTSQAGLHLAFGAAGSHATATRQGMTPLAMRGMRMIHTTTPPPHAVTPHATAAHLCAAVLLTWWLRRGEAALWSLLRRSVALVPGLAAWWQGYGEPAAPDPACPAPDHGTRTPRRLLLRHTVHRRGPPTTIPYAI
ncbi:hypothetical protein [Streptomyces sp. 351MFTsu5.1]|uniref:hypothetical protein n=1 Tax=Streptomyces sp. 351MFTsu5.1 TaxID=1172180 RepID=UPI00039DC72B|nr:hypothetical protein [Streptomyces sp. 351MFTsu5.1]